MRPWMFAALMGLALAAIPRSAAAQYKNTAFNLDVGYELLTRPDILDSNGAILSPDHLPVHLGHGYRFGGEIDFKLHADHWWFTARLNGKLYFYDPGSDPNPVVQSYDQQALAAIGTLLGIEGDVGVRYYFLTDRIRPYLGLTVSYMHLFSFTSIGSSACPASLCTGGGTYSDNYLPHSNIFAVHAHPGVEFILVRDLALVLSVDVARWLIINAEGNWLFGPRLGVIFYG